MCNKPIWLVTPPLTQLNMPYPATTVLTGFLKQNNVPAYQTDLGIELIDTLFTNTKLAELFAAINYNKATAAHKKMLNMQYFYCNTIEPVKYFLRTADVGIANKICTRQYLPEGSRFNNLADLDWHFGDMGLTDKAKHLATFYIQDIVDLIRQNIDNGFELIKYQHHLCITLPTFDELYNKVTAKKNSFVDALIIDIFQKFYNIYKPQIIGFTIPFPGNLYAALVCAQHAKILNPQVKIIFGGGYVTTELRQITDTRIFNFTDYLVFDDGEQPLLEIIKTENGKSGSLNNVYTLQNSTIKKWYSPGLQSIPFSQTSIPDYTGIDSNKYLSLIETVNPMHKLWSDGFWNKLTLAHGCYWGKCTFCDTKLNYISKFEGQPATVIVDKIKLIIKQTGKTGFHFTDEAAPPALLKQLAIELIKQKINITWWGNIRFEQAYTNDLCRLLAASGCIAVTGGIETASDRLLKLIDKGVTIEQLARVNRNFKQNGIMVHAYLMYGFPSQTVHETIDALEVVRQFFENGLIQSGFWHRFALTCHSIVAQNTAKYNIVINNPAPNPFANNEICFTDKVKTPVDELGDGLSRAMYNYLNGVGIDMPVHKWFGISVQKTKLPPGLIASYIKQKEPLNLKKHAIWLGGMPQVFDNENSSKLFLNSPKNSTIIIADSQQTEWLAKLLNTLTINNIQAQTLNDINNAFEKNFGVPFITQSWFALLQKAGLIFV